MSKPVSKHISKRRKFLLAFMAFLFLFPLSLYGCGDEETSDSSPDSSQNQSGNLGGENQESGNQGSDEPQNPPTTQPTIKNEDVPSIMQNAAQILQSASERFFVTIQDEAAQSALNLSGSAQTALPDFYEPTATQILPTTLAALHPFQALAYIFEKVNLQSGYQNEYTLEQTVYETGFVDTADVFCDTNTKTTVAFRAEKQSDFILFHLQYRADESHFSSCVGKIQYDFDFGNIGKIYLASYQSSSDSYLSFTLDHVNATAYFIEAINGENASLSQSSAQSSAQNFIEDFASGALKYSQSRKYPFRSIRAAHWNTNPNTPFSYSALTKSNPTLEKGTEYDVIQTLEEQSFANLYNTVYANVSMLPFEINALDVKDGKAVNYLNAATRYATNASKCEIIGKTAHFSYLQETDMQTLLSTLERYEIFKNDTKLSSFFMGVNNAFTLAKNRYVGELGVFGGKTYTLSRELPDTVLSSLDPHANALSIALRERKYQLTDGENELTFLLENTRLVLIDGAIEHTKNLTFSYLPNVRAYAVMINGDCTDQELTIPMRRLLLPVVQMNAIGDFLPTLSLEKLTLPYTIQTIKANAFLHFSALERVDFLGTADQWAEIDFENEESSPTRLSKNLYIQGTILTSATLRSATKIQPYAFMNCQSLSAINLGESVQFVAPNAFIGCDNLQANATYQGAQYLHFGNKPFRFLLRTDNANVRSVTLHENTEIIACNAFKNCKNLQTVHWNNAVKTIGASAFFGCTFLQNCTLPASVCEIGAFAFSLYQNANITLANPNHWFAFLKIDQSDLAPISKEDLEYLLVNDTEGYSFVRTS